MIQVRRVSAAREPSLLTSLRAALDVTKGTIEIADDGPLAINDFRIPGDARVIRARSGFRPIIRAERPTSDYLATMPGVIVLDRKTLVLESLDLVVNVRELPTAQSSLFCCSGSDLTVRNCTITLSNPAGQSFCLVRAEGSAARGSRVRFENCLVRGSLSTGFELGKGSVEVVFRESVLLGSQGPVVRSTVVDRTSDHRFYTVGSLLACRGPAFELKAEAGLAGQKPRPLTVRALETALGRFQGAGIASVVSTTKSDSSPRDQLDWSGRQNLFCGWKGFFSSGADHTVRVASLAALRSTWNDTDPQSQEVPVAWPQPFELRRAVPAVLAPYLPARYAALFRGPSPPPFLAAKTLSSFPVPSVPLPLIVTTPSAGEPQPRWGTYSGMQGTGQGQETVLRSIKQKGQAIAVSAAGRAGDLIFDADSEEWHGDLGAFLQRKVGEGVKHARVLVIGSGARRSSPVRLPDGIALEIRVEAPARADSEWLSWSPEAESGGRALLELRGGSLLLSQVRLAADEKASIESLVHVEDGNLVLHRCLLEAPPGAETRTQCLVSFKAASTRPREAPAQPGLFATEPARPVCFVAESTMIGSASGIRAELGRGLIVLSQTAMATAGDSLELVPARVARGRFEADLVLDHCTVASETNIVHIGSWPGRGTGPDRPWLITSSNCAFLGTYDRRTSGTVLLRADEEALAHGTVFWRGASDAIDVEAFTAVGLDPPPSRPRDVVYQWVNFWGNSQMRDIRGPRTGSNQAAVRLVERLRPGRIEPSDLILDPDFHPGRALLDVGADLARQGIHRSSGSPGRRR
jgi:serine/threonine-protein kinase